MKQKTIAIIHFNTPELTEACILSIRKHGGRDYRVVVFDNSDERPFHVQMAGVEVIDNTHAQVINFEAMLAAFPDRDDSIGCAQGCDYGSAKHMMTVQKLWELLPDGFVLVESDILLKRDIEEFFDPTHSVYGYWQKAQPHNPFGIGRMLPMLCWMNVPLLTKYGAKYFDPKRTYGLLPGGRGNRNNWYDTGAVLLEDIIKNRPNLVGRHCDIRDYVEHFGSGSWRNNNLKAQAEWLKQYRKLWEPEGCKNGKVAVCAIGRLENRYAREWVEHYKRLGVDKIFIYDNNRVEDCEIFADVLQSYIDNGLVEISPWDGLQKQAYEDCYNRHNQDYEWIGFFDFDELVCLEKCNDIHNFMDGCEADVLVMNWCTMTDSGLVHYDDRPMVERFTEGTEESFAINRHVKSFVHSGIVGISFNDPHCPNVPKLNVVNVLGEQVEQVPIQPAVIHRVAWINHYNTKTAEEWATLKMRRLSPCGDDYNREMKAKNVEYFFSINERTPEKESILGVIAPPSFDEAQGTPIVEHKKKVSKPKTAKRTNSKKE